MAHRRQRAHCSRLGKACRGRSTAGYLGPRAIQDVRDSRGARCRTGAARGLGMAAAGPGACAEEVCSDRYTRAKDSRSPSSRSLCVCPSGRRIAPACRSHRHKDSIGTSNRIGTHGSDERRFHRQHAPVFNARSHWPRATGYRRASVLALTAQNREGGITRSVDNGGAPGTRDCRPGSSLAGCIRLNTRPTALRLAGLAGRVRFAISRLDRRGRYRLEVRARSGRASTETPRRRAGCRRWCGCRSADGRARVARACGLAAGCEAGRRGHPARRSADVRAGSAGPSAARVSDRAVYPHPDRGGRGSSSSASRTDRCRSTWRRHRARGDARGAAVVDRFGHGRCGRCRGRVARSLRFRVSGDYSFGARNARAGGPRRRKRFVTDRGCHSRSWHDPPFVSPRCSRW